MITSLQKTLTLILLFTTIFSHSNAQCIEQNLTSTGTSYASNDGTELKSFGQHFKASCNGELRSVSLKCAASGYASGTIHLYSGADLSSATLINSQPFSALINSNEFVVPINARPYLNSGSDYIFMFAPAYGTGYGMFLATDGNSYPNGEEWIQSNITGIFSQPLDLYFKAVIGPDCHTARSLTTITKCSEQLPYVWNGITFNSTRSDSVYLPLPSGCDSIATLNFIVPQVHLSSTAAGNVVCPGDSAIITASGTGTYAWQSLNATISSTISSTITAHPSVGPSIYMVTNDDQGCLTYDTLHLNMPPAIDLSLPVIAIDSFLCHGGDSTTIMVLNSNPMISYVLMDDDNDAISASQVGNNDTLLFNTGAITQYGHNTFYIKATNENLQNNALLFNGNDQYVSIASQMPQQGATIEAWIKKTNWADFGDDRVFYNGINYGTAGSFYLSLHPSVGFHYRYGGLPDANNQYLATNYLPSYAANSWHHVAISYERNLANTSTTIKLYVDGSLVSQTTTPLWINVQSMYFGGNGLDGVNFGEGAMRTARIWDRALSDAEVQSYYTQNLPATTPNLVHLYNFTETSGTTTLDECAGGTDGVLHNYNSDNDAWLINKTLCVEHKQLINSANVQVGYTNNTHISYCSSQLPYNWYGVDYSTDTIVAKIITSATSCDTFAVLNLNVLQTISNAQNINLCAGGSLSVGAHTYTVSGTYLDTLNAYNGCDSIITTNLNIENTIDTTVTIAGDSITANANGYMYLWCDCNNNYNPVSLIGNQSYTPTQSGSYAVIIGTPYCQDTSTCVNMILTGLSDRSKSVELNIYPNPAKDFFTIDLKQYNTSNDAYMTVTDAFGKVILKQKISATITNINTRNFPEGVYTINVYSNYLQSIKKLVIY